MTLTAFKGRCPHCGHNHQDSEAEFEFAVGMASRKLQSKDQIIERKIKENDELRQQLAAKDQRIAELEELASQHFDQAEHYRKASLEKSAKLADLQAEIKELRKALEEIIEYSVDKVATFMAREALSRPTDTSALDAAIEKAVADEREACARVCEKRAEERFNELGTRESDTGACYYSGRHGEVLEAIDEEDSDCAAAIRARSGK